MKYCGFCCELMQKGSLQRHCTTVHSAPCRALKKGEKPSAPIYRNWPDWVKDPANVIPRPMVRVVNDVNKDTCGLGHKDEP